MSAGCSAMRLAPSYTFSMASFHSSRTCNHACLHTLQQHNALSSAWQGRWDASTSINTSWAWAPHESADNFSIAAFELPAGDYIKYINILMKSPEGRSRVEPQRPLELCIMIRHSRLRTPEEGEHNRFRRAELCAWSARAAYGQSERCVLTQSPSRVSAGGSTMS